MLKCLSCSFVAGGSRLFGEYCNTDFADLLVGLVVMHLLPLQAIYNFRRSERSHTILGFFDFRHLFRN